LGRRELAAIFIEQNHQVVAFDSGEQLCAFRGHQPLLVAAPLFFQLAHFGGGEAFDPVQVIVNQRGAMTIPGFADPNEMQLHVSG
jgi:hypothetical protein